MSRTTICACLVGLALPAEALAWQHTYIAWTPDDFPLEYWVADDGTAESDCEGSVMQPSDDPAGGYCALAAQQGFAAWEAAVCAGITSRYMGVCDNIGFNASNRLNFITFDDPTASPDNPDGDIPEPGTWAATRTTPEGTAFVKNGVRYNHAVDSDIVFNDNVLFERDTNIPGNCNGGSNFRSIMTHEIGHMLGLGHSCERGEACLDQKLQLATMEWSEGLCETHGIDINEDDIEGITALYGPFATFQCSHEVDPGDSATSTIGVVCPNGEPCETPFNLKCTVVSDAYEELVADDTTWDWGDGGTSTGLEVSHTYVEPGNYTVRANVAGTNETCGEWDYTYRRVGYVTACDVPAAAISVEHVDGLTYTLVNDTDISVYGCILSIQWDIYKGGSDEPIDSLSAWEPEYTFPEEGEYRVVLNVGGYAGTGAAELKFEAERKRGSARSCDTSGAGGTAALLLLALLARRRRE